jgi:hypothetical protein
MSQRSASGEHGDESGAGPVREPSYPGVPRWVKVSVGVVLLLVVVLVLLTALGLHAPGGPGVHGV